MTKHSINILIADDSEDDRIIFQLALHRSREFEVCGVAVDGIDTINHLNAVPPYSDRGVYPYPDLLLLDLNMPGVDGFQVLEWLQANPFPNLAVAVLSGSSTPDEIEQALMMGAHFFQTKQLGNGKQLLALKALEQQVIRNKEAAGGRWVNLLA